MLKNASFFHMITGNIMIITIWHCLVFIICIRLPDSVYNPGKNRYMPFRWERHGKWYRDKLKINRWKDKVPQYIAKNGFSKEHLDGMSLEYVDEFIMETCRGEWMHLNNCCCTVVVFLINPPVWGVVFSFLILLGNLPFVCIQRYNRFRLQVLRKSILRGTRVSTVHGGTVSA